MRLKKLQVSGFKSFVDPTDIRLPSHLVGVVGPNGCGKSNVIDAVRWVMGESSAKMLRGDNMEDVIFNGSSARKPVGKASVELIFDNHDGLAPGNYGQFAEIAIKRTLTRDGQSTYLINNIKTRRKDVLDLFRGTGLGPRSYSIIEQGMVSRIVEARPDDLRVFVEEAAGTSKYKDRRKETETRIAHTRENLDRVADIRDELGKQLRRLKRQSASARRYKVLKAEEREVQGQLNVLRLYALNAQREDQDRLTAKQENQLQNNLSAQREFESQIEALRKQQSDAHEINNEIQQEFYRIGAQITNLEQQIEHRKENTRREAEEINRLDTGKVALQQQIDSETEKGVAMRQQLEALLPGLESSQAMCSEAEAELSNSEKILQDWLGEMEAFNEQSRAPAQQVEVQKSRIHQLQQNLLRTEQSKARLDGEFKLLSEQTSEKNIESLRQQVVEHDANYHQVETRFNQSEQSLKELYAQIEQKREQAANARTQLQEVASRLQSLEEIQAASQGEDNAAIDDWLSTAGMHQVSKLAGKMKVEAGWEKAADRVLNGYLSALCINDLTLDTLNLRPSCALSIVSQRSTEYFQSRVSLNGTSVDRMIDKIVEGANYISGVLSGVYAVDSIEQGLAVQNQLAGHEYIVTRQGELIGSNWVSFASQSQIETGMLVREDEIAQLRERKAEISLNLQAQESNIDSLDQLKSEQEATVSWQRDDLNKLRADLTVVHNKFGREETQYIEACDQIKKLSQELSELVRQLASDQAEIKNAEALLETASQETGNFDQQREKLNIRRDELNTLVSEKRGLANQMREKYHADTLQKQKFEADMGVTRENIKRLRGELEQTDSRLIGLRDNASSPSDSIVQLEENLSKLLDNKLEVEDRFTSARDVASSFDSKIDEVNHSRSEKIKQVNEAREVLEQQKLIRQEVLVRRDTLLESIKQQEFNVEECAEQLTDDANVEDWQERLTSIESKIARIGPVNLVAIEEFDEESERMDYLDKQHTDLTEALDTLESVIRKIDRETRSRFKETFDKINAGFNQFFPKLFGGGKAELQLTSEDLLTTGISVIAQPPGKRNSHIHLLSGGEKALTAVALLFSLFELNPAPFCMLDEVDAPLDDANVDRYCEALKTLANKSQMIVITHNKITMETMDLLVGVTMAEAGVSRLVSVDIDQAVEMAKQ